VAPPDRELLRKLAEWETHGRPVTTLYMDVDGRRYPQRGALISRAEDLARRARDRAPQDDREAQRSVGGDAERIERYVREEFDRSGVRGLALFSCSGAGLWQDVPISRTVRDRVVVAPRPYLLPLESVVEVAETVCTVLVDREKARVLLSRLGDIEEVTSILDDVPGQHDQGGWAQARLQRHIEDHVQRHLKRVAEALLRLYQERGFDHLVLSGSDEIVPELERELHDYVRRTVIDRVNLPIGANPTEVLDHATALEMDLERRQEEETVSRVAQEASAGTGRGVSGLQDTLVALEAGRVETLVVAADLSAPGVRCPSCGHLAPSGDTCAACGSRTEDVPDVVEESVELALRSGARVESVGQVPRLEEIGGIGALLRF
jgi:peptide chain release factor subunit 1